METCHGSQWGTTVSPQSLTTIDTPLAGGAKDMRLLRAATSVLFALTLMWIASFVATPEKVEPWKQGDPGVAKADATSGLRLTW